MDGILEQDFRFQNLFDQVLTNRPEVEAMQLNEDASQKEIDIMRSFYLPSVSLGAGLSTNFSSLGKTSTNISRQRVPQEGVFINGDPVQFEIERDVAGDIFKTPYFDQLNENLGIGIGIQLNVPIYDRGNARTNVKRAEYALDQIKNANEQTINNLELEINQIVIDFENAKAQYLSGQKRVEFLQNSYDNVLNDMN